MRSVQYLSHTTDIRMKVMGDTLQDLFAISLEGMNNILKKGECDQLQRQTFRQDINLTSHDVTTLLIEFLGSVLTFTHVYKTMFCKMKVKELTQTTIKGWVYGHRIEMLDEDIKAVTYHEANIQLNVDGQFETLILFDV